MNIVHLTGTVRYVHVKSYTDYVQVSLKVELPDTTILWVQVKNVDKAHGDLDKLQKLNENIVTIEGKLSSRYKAPNPPQYPDERTFYDVATKPGGVKPLSTMLEGPLANCTQLSGKIKEIKDLKGRVFFKLGLRFYNPSTKTFGEWFARIRCPEGFQQDTIEVGQEVTVVGHLADSDGAVVNATQVVDVLRL
jgi:hypothetical protein